MPGAEVSDPCAPVECAVRGSLALLALARPRVLHLDDPFALRLLELLEVDAGDRLLQRRLARQETGLLLLAEVRLAVDLAELVLVADLHRVEVVLQQLRPAW